METKDRIAFIAHNNKKVEMGAFLYENRRIIMDSCEICVATATTGKELERMGFPTKAYKSGPEGGDAQIASRIVEDKIKMVIFFIDPDFAHPHDADIKMLERTCVKKNIPFATNWATAEILIKSAKSIVV